MTTRERIAGILREGYTAYAEHVNPLVALRARLTGEPGSPYETDAGITGEVRGYRPGDRIRVTYGDTTVQVAVSAAGGGRSVLVFHQEGMAGPEERERQRAHWQRVMDQVAEELDRPA